MMDAAHDESHIEPNTDVRAMPRDSLVTVRLSEPPSLTVDPNALEHTPIATMEDTKGQERPEIVPEEDGTQEESPTITMMDPNGDEVTSPTASESMIPRDRGSRRGSCSSEVSAEDVNWEELEKTEEQEPRNEASDNVRQRAS